MAQTSAFSPHNLSLNEDNCVNMQFADPKNDSFLMSVHLKWKGSSPLDVALLENVLNILIQRHESLRYSYHINPETKRGFRKIHSELPRFAAEIVKLPAEEDSSRLLAETMKELGHTIMDLEKAPLMRAFVVYASKSTYFVFAVHHIVNDVVSFILLLKEFEILYTVYKISKEPLTLKSAEEILGGPAGRYSAYANKERESYKKKIEGLLQFYGERVKRLDKSPCFLQTNNPANKINYRDYVFNLTPAINEFFEKRKPNMSKLILTVYQIAIYQTLGLKCATITTLYHNRGSKDVMNISGYVANEHAWIEEVVPQMRISELYEKNIKLAEEMRKFMDIDSLAILQHFKTPEFCPIPRFKLNYVPRSVWKQEDMSQLFDDVTENGDYERKTWFGERYRIKFGILITEFKNYFNFRFWRVCEVFKDKEFEALKSNIIRLMDSIPDIFDRKIGEVLKEKPEPKL